MSTWDHRILVQEYEKSFWFAFHEVHYDDSGKAWGSTENATDVSGESIEELRWVLKGMETGLRKPALWKGEKFPQEWDIPTNTKDGLLYLINQKIQTYHVHRNHSDLGDGTLLTDFFSDFTRSDSVISHNMRRHIKYSGDHDDTFYIQVHMDRLEKFTVYKEAYSEADYDFVIKLEGKNISEVCHNDLDNGNYAGPINYSDEKWFYMSAINNRNNIDENLQNDLEKALHDYLLSIAEK